MWRDIKPKMEKVGWHKLVWAAFIVPKHAIVAWMAILNRLPTKDRVKSWGLEVDGRCVLCREAEETRNHLFYGCEFSQGIWREVLKLCGKQREVTSWDEEFQWIVKKLKRKSLASVIMRVAWHTIIYIIWAERNNRIHTRRAQ